MQLMMTFKKGDRFRLLGFAEANLTYRRKLISLGLTPGSTIEIVRRAPLGCPVEVLLRNTAIAFRVHELACLEWEAV